MWDIRYRPLRFADVLGQQGTVQLLTARVRRGSVLDTSYLFSGGHGQGKTTLARILARAALCPQVDKDRGEPCNVCEQCVAILNGEPSAFEERDAASGGTINIVRAMLDDLPFMPPLGAPRRVWLFDEAHRLPTASQDALLKPLEEKKVVGIFCTTEPEKIRGAIRGRCEEWAIRRVTREDVLARMGHVLTTEGVEYRDEAVLMVIDHCHGHVRDILNRLETLSQLGPIGVDSVREYLNLSLVSTYYEILLACAAGDARGAMDLVEGAAERADPDDIVGGIAEAAMNSYRLATGLFADFSEVEPALAQKVFQAFGVNVIRVADYVLRSRAVTKTSLESDILVLAQSNGAIPQPAAAQGAVPFPIAPPVMPGPLVPTESAPPSAPISAAVPQQHAARPMSPSAKATPGAPPVRPDGVGSLGSGDPGALTEYDHNGVPTSYPRSLRLNRDQPLHLSADLCGDNDPARLELITPGDWKRLYLQRLFPRPAPSRS